MAKKKKSPNNEQLWQSVQTIAHECVSLRERLTTLENLFDLLLTYKGDNQDFIEFVKSKVGGDENETNEVQDTDKKEMKEVVQTREQGQKEYARTQSDVFANFKRVAKDLDSSPEKVLLTYFLKHKDGIVSWANGHTSQREDVRGRIKDAIVYLMLLWGMVESSE